MLRFHHAVLAGSRLVLLAVVSLLLLMAGQKTVAEHTTVQTTTTTQFDNNEEENPSQKRQEQKVFPMNTTDAKKNITEQADITNCDVNNGEYQDTTSESCYAADVDLPSSDDHGTVPAEDSNTGLVSPNVVAAAHPEDHGADDFGKVQVMDHNSADAVMAKLESMRKYMKETVLVDEKYKHVKDICKNLHENCAYWAALGECDNNSAYMPINCAPVCQTCEFWHFETRCPLDPNAVDAFAQPGDVNKMFTRIISDPAYKQFGPKVLSRPDLATGDTEETADYKVGGPWMLLFENAVTDEEADRLIELGGKLGYERSYEVGELQADGTYSKNINNGRTSTTAWCYDECYTDPLAQSVMNRIANITGIPEANSEHLQLLHYEKDQFYKVHNDYIAYQRERQPGVRILTFFFYLNDVEEGGETSFPDVGLTVQPKKGQAILWPSVLDQDPSNYDERTDHTAMPVIQGVKYGANAWIHQRDFKTPNEIGCA